MTTNDIKRPTDVSTKVVYKFRLLDDKKKSRQMGKLPPVDPHIDVRSIAYLALSHAIPRPETGWRVEVLRVGDRVYAFDVRRATSYHVELIPAS